MDFACTAPAEPGDVGAAADWLVQAGLADVPLRELSPWSSPRAPRRLSRVRRLRRAAPRRWSSGCSPPPFPSRPTDARRTPTGGGDGCMAAAARGAPDPDLVARPLDPPGPLRGRAARAGGAAPGVRGRPPRVAALHRLRAHARVLKAHLADPTADAVCETLLVAHEVGGTDLDRRLEALIDDRVQDTQGRKDAGPSRPGPASPAASCSSSPPGMALAGMSVGTGRAAYQTPPASCWSCWRSRWSSAAGSGRAASWRCPRSSGCSMPRLLAASCVLLAVGADPRPLRAAVVQPSAARRTAAALRPGRPRRDRRRRRAPVGGVVPRGHRSARRGRSVSGWPRCSA